MRKSYLSSIGMGSLLAVGATLAFHADAPAQSDTTEVEIIFDGVFKFKKEDVDIKEGQSIRWSSKVKGTHRLEPVSPTTEADFKTSKNFTIPKQGTTPDSETRKFEKATSTPIKYRCAIHKATMKGTITVKK